MSYQTIDYAKLSRRDVLKCDPRVAIARHMDWQPNYNSKAAVAWTLPEPVNYNRAVCGPRPIECKFITNNIFYRDEKTQKWWSVYYVTEQLQAKFEDWIKLQDIEIYWFNCKPVRMREHQKLLYNIKNGEINTNERLFQMGYYAKLGSKYFADANDTMLLDRLGPIRDRVYDRAEEGLTSKFDFDADQL